MTLQSIDVGSCLDESAHDCGTAVLEPGSKVQRGHLGGNNVEQQQNMNYWSSLNWYFVPIVYVLFIVASGSSNFILILFKGICTMTWRTFYTFYP